MPTVITKKSTVAGKVPLDTDLQIGELAVNTADGLIFTKHSDSTVVEINKSAMLDIQSSVQFGGF